MSPIATIASAPGWFTLTEHEDTRPDGSGRWCREPVAAWSLRTDGRVVALVPRGAELVEPPDPLTYIHESATLACDCATPARTLLDRRWCTACGGTTDG